MDEIIANLDVSNSDEEEIDFTPNQNQGGQESEVAVEFQNDSVSAVNHCQSEDARKLCLFNLDYKLLQNDQYDIGGTYTKMKPDLWFYFSTTVCPDANYVLNIFVCHRSMGSVAISISDSKALTKVKTKDPFSYYLLTSNNLTTKTFNSAKVDQSHYIASYCFTQEDLSILENKILGIPIKITIGPKCPVNIDFITGIKSRHGLTTLFKRQENTDFVLISTSGTKYDTHKIILATHSPVLKEIIRTTKSNSANVDVNDEEMELMLEFMYTGTVQKLLDKNLNQLIEIAYKLKLDNLNALTQHAITEKITIKNAVEIAVLTEKYQLDVIQKTVFEFIKQNPQVLETEGWQNLTDVALTKKLFKEIYVQQLQK